LLSHIYNVSRLHVLPHKKTLPRLAFRSYSSCLQHRPILLSAVASKDLTPDKCSIQFCKDSLALPIYWLAFHSSQVITTLLTTSPSPSLPSTGFPGFYPHPTLSKPCCHYCVPHTTRPVRSARSCSFFVHPKPNLSDAVVTNTTRPVGCRAHLHFQIPNRLSFCGRPPSVVPQFRYSKSLHRESLAIVLPIDRVINLFRRR